MTAAELIAVYEAHADEIGWFADDRHTIEKEGTLLFGMDAPVIAGRLLTIYDPALALVHWARLSPDYSGTLGTLTPDKHAAVLALLQTVTTSSHA